MIKYSYAMAEPAKDKSKIGKNKNIKINLKKVLTFVFPYGIFNFVVKRNCLKAGKHFRGVAQLG